MSTVTQPPAPEDPATVYLLSSGRHAGLVLPRADGRLVEYGYGDWSWYALAEDDWWRAPGTVLWPNRAALGRRDVGPEELDSVDGPGRLVPIVVARARAGALLERLEREFAAAGEPHYNAAYDMEFVAHPRRFWIFHDCHDEVAEWLESLGCTVCWSPIRTRLRLASGP